MEIYLLKTSRDSQTLFAAVTHLVEELRLETLLILKVEKSLNFLFGYTETNRIHNGTTVSSVLENVNKKASRFCRLQ
jgi:hypothetical protein